MTEMHWHPARVCSSDAQALTLMFERPEHCQRCQAGQGCGAGLWARLFVSTQPTTMTVPRQQVQSDMAFMDGDWVRVGVPSTVLARVAFSVYGWPLLVFVATLALAPTDWPEAGVLALALVAAVAAVAFSRRRRDGTWAMHIEGLKVPPIKPTS